MINFTLYLLVFCGILIVYFRLCQRNQEGFEINNEISLYSDKHYTTRTEYEDIYDDFYAFYFDEMFYNHEYYTMLCNIILHYNNPVFNNHLVLGNMNGGHINSILEDSMQTLTTSRSSSIIKKCRYNYEDNNYQHIPDYSKSQLFNPNEFTHISIVDDEVYTNRNLLDMIHNCSNWLMFKGKLFIPLYNSKNNFEQAFGNVKQDSNVLKKYVYSSQLSHNDHNNYTWIERMKLKNSSKVRKNLHEITYYHPDYILSMCDNFGLKFVEKHIINSKTSLYVFENLQ